MWTSWCLFVMRSMISRRASGGWSPTCARASRSRPDHRRGQWQHGRHLGDRRPAGRASCPRCAPCTWSCRDAAGRCGTIWSHSEADVLAYMDVDLSTDLNALLPLVAPLLSGHSDLAIGTRLARGSRVIRGPKRELISRGYNLLLRTLMGARFSDAQCGFKAIRRDQAPGAAAARPGHRLVLRHRTAGAGRAGRAAHPRGPGGLDRRPRLARRHRRHRPGRPARHGQARRGLRARLHPGPAAARARLGQQRGCRRGLPLQVARFAVIGVASTMAYVALFLLLRLAMRARPRTWSACC